MTGFAADTDLRPGRCVAVVRRIVVLADAGRVALRAHEIPVLIELGPMQDVVMLDVLVRIEMEPALSAFFLRAAIPRDRERLHAPVWKLDQILLKWIDAEGEFHLEGGQLAIRPVGFDKIFPVLARKT